MPGDPLSAIGSRVHTPQREKADDRQSKNAAGGYTFTASVPARVNRFFTLGTDGGTYYTSERELTKESAGVIIGAARLNGLELVKAATEISVAGRAPRNDPALFTIAAVSGLGDTEARRAAFAAVADVARTGGHLLTWARYREQFGGWGHGAMRAVSDWYMSRDAHEIAYQALKYKQREGFSHFDLLQLARPGKRGGTSWVEIPPAHRALFAWLRGDKNADLSELPLAEAAVKAHRTRDTGEWVRLIRENRSLTREMLPSEALAKAAVWEAMLLNGNLPMDAMLRNLAQTTRLGVLAPANSATSYVAAQLTDAGRLAKARIHPVSVLVALRTYASGHGARGDSTWSPVTEVTDALDQAFYLSFGAAEPSGKRHVLGLDVSGSMSNPVSGLPISCREAAAAMAMTTAATEPHTAVMGFAGEFRDLGISPRQRLDDAIRRAYCQDFGRTDCALPMMWAMRYGLNVDHFVIYTDNETWYGPVHPHQALAEYRRRSGIDARLSVVAMTATGRTIADPDDPGMMDVSGFDAAVPGLLANFARGDI
jgi:60 kDa SS-A/Ro ribonucleoprotein